jgi:hypothetical protein
VRPTAPPLPVPHHRRLMPKIWMKEEGTIYVHAMWTHLEVRILSQKPQQLNQRGFHPSHNNFAKATFLKVTTHDSFY